MKFLVDAQIFERFPGLILGVVVVSGIDNRTKSENVLRQIREQEEKIRQDFLAETLSQIPKIQAWRRAYSEFGAKPKKYRSSVESLYKMILRGIPLRSINTLVDIYNYSSIKHMIPMGGDDLDKVEGDIALRFARGDERFIPLNTQEEEHAKPGEVVYADEKDILCRRWNWRECDKTKMTEETKNAILVAEGLPPVLNTEVEAAVTDLSQLVLKHCGGDAKSSILDVKCPEISL